MKFSLQQTNILIKALTCSVITLWLSGCENKPSFSYDFERPEDLDRLKWKCGVQFTISDQYATQGKKSLALHLFSPGKDDFNKYRGVIFQNFSPDWSDDDFLIIDVYNPQDKPLPMTLRIDDRKSPPYDDRFNKELLFLPGENQLLIPLETLYTTEGNRQLNRKNIRHVSLFYSYPKENYLLYIDNCRLE